MKTIFEFEIGEFILIRKTNQICRVFEHSILPNGSLEYCTQKVGLFGCYGEDELYLEKELHKAGGSKRNTFTLGSIDDVRDQPNQPIRRGN